MGGIGLEKEIKAQFSESILHEAANKFGFQTNNLTNLHGFQNFVYEASRAEQSYILRISHSSHRSDVMIQAELDWINFLSDHGVRAAKPVPALTGEWLIRIEHGNSYFTATSFEKAVGMKPDWRLYSDDQRLTEQLGRITGRIHALSKKYEIKDGSPRRCDWYENHYLTKFSSYIPDSYLNLIEKTNQFIHRLTEMPKDHHSYGLIHGDIHINNFHIDKDELTLFDFDECEYSWFASDIANPLFYATPLPSDGKEKRTLIAQRFYNHFMEGYAKENTLEESWLKRIPLFLRLREILVYSGAFRSLDLHNLHPWSKEMIETTTSNIEKDLPFLEIRFT